MSNKKMNIFEPYVERTRDALAKLTQDEIRELNEEALRRTEEAYQSLKKARR